VSKAVRHALAWLVLLSASVSSVAAHALSVSYGHFSIDDGRVAAVVRIPLDDLDLLLRLDRDLDGRVSDAELAAARTALASYIDRHLRVRGDGAPLAGTLDRLVFWRDPASFEYIEANLTFTAPRPVRAVAVESDVLVDLYPHHKMLGEFVFARGGRADEFVLEPGRPYERRVAERRAWTTAISFVRLGIEHIFTGYDHILFLFGLLLVGNGPRSLVAIVTSFTIAHSLTLAVATLGLVSPAPWTVEAAIALSIAYIGVENLFVRNPRHRWKITFVFGLVHGFGFAAVLRDMELARAGLALSLFSFNLGVEIGQVAIVSLMYPVLVLMSHTEHRVLITRVASSVIAAVGLVWFYQRLPR
jgi:hydrogenase/urease accessory protein HupE